MKTLPLLFTLISFSIVTAQEVISEDVFLKNGAIELPGSLTYCSNSKKLPLVIFIHGSGNIDRNGNQYPFIQANYIKQLSDNLVKKNIAFYRYDKRTSNPANFEKLEGITAKDFVEDAQIAIQHFKTDNRFSTIHLIGHSQGSLIAMFAIDKSVNSYISLAGAGKPLSKLIVEQIASQNKDLAKTAKLHIEELNSTDTIKNVHPELPFFGAANHKFLKHYFFINPVEEIKKLQLPILILQGEKDIQVSNEDAELLHSANPNSELLLISEMNHVLKQVTTLEENKQSYSDSSYPISSELIKAIEYFVNHNNE